MKDLINKMISLGYGVAETSKEQIEKLVDELVKKGEISRAESMGLVNDIMVKAGEAQRKAMDSIRDAVASVAAELQLATKEDVERLERKIDALSGNLNETEG
ncbi:phasin family protein [Paenibacillus protaetiae]|uniref:Polyhydroxyalkanoate synthesis regulator n=1 Tax=Paenibacillus protaetiae TaxID=2509456 RepID=A0A4P6EW05_9BACL|nr:hypothetical protein [Paenibacillus protaetiae]QAY67194.1 hypothetical protein ET464_13080 [Paenibacillus protaetiae]